ncbi:alpha/beta fold hydrolase [Streptomyces sp. NPDC051567]|uniref:alpha/beta fold hydrolase n=1 Tax=Streptomyces sp. NPDC051567 TaxID=3365660 RepID=UPI00378ABD7D
MALAPGPVNAHIRRHDDAGAVCVSRTVPRPDPSAEPVLIIGGLTDDRDSWHRHEREICGFATLFTLDLPGYGPTQALPGGQDLASLTAVLHQVLAELTDRKVTLAGYSFGTVIAHRYASLHPDRVRRLALFALFDPARSQDSSARLTRLVELFDRGRVDAFARETASVIRSLDPGSGPEKRMMHALLLRELRTGPREYRNALANTVRLMAGPIDLTVALAVPVLIVTVEHDTYSTPRYGRRLADALGARHEEVSGAGHALPLERPDAFCRLLYEFSKAPVPATPPAEVAARMPGDPSSPRPRS